MKRRNKIILALSIAALSIALLSGLTNKLGRAFLGQFHFAKGYNFSQEGDYAKAIKAYGKALVCDPGIKYVNQNIGVILQGLKRYDEAVKYYELELENNPQNEEVRVELAYLKEFKRQSALYEEIGRFIEIVREYADSDNRFIGALNGLKEEYGDKYFSGNKIKGLLSEAKLDYCNIRDKAEDIRVTDESIGQVEGLLIDALNRRVDTIDYILGNDIIITNYAAMREECVKMLKEADSYFVSALEEIRVSAGSITMIPRQNVERELTDAISYYTNYNFRGNHF